MATYELQAKHTDLFCLSPDLCCSTPLLVTRPLESLYAVTAVSLGSLGRANGSAELFFCEPINVEYWTTREREIRGTQG